MASFLDQIPTLIVVLAHQRLVCTCVLLAVLFGGLRYGVGKPLRILSQAARKVAAGDFSVQIPPVRRDGKKDELEVLIEDFNTMARELAGNEMLKSDFIANVSHEIKTPLSIIQSYTKALKDGCVPEAQKEQYMDAILAASSNLSLMVTNILKAKQAGKPADFSRAGKLSAGRAIAPVRVGLYGTLAGKEYCIFHRCSRRDGALRSVPSGIG